MKPNKAQLAAQLTECPEPPSAGSELPQLEHGPPAREWGGLELAYPHRLVAPPAWVAHTPFAFWIVEALKPRIIVELGVHSGNSYCAFLQAVKSLGLTTRCYGIDHWRGDEHSGAYGEEVHAELQGYHDPLYGAFSTLTRSTFQEALPYFSDGTVDLLHIDGLHTFEAVRADFTSWLPKMSSRGMVIFHDVNVRERGFGVWQLWQEIASRYLHVEFIHSSGLGAVYVGREPLPEPLQAVFGVVQEDAIARVRAYFARLGTSIYERFALREAESELRNVRAELTRKIREFESHAAELQAARDEVHGGNAQLAALRGEFEAQLNARLADAERQQARIIDLEAELSARRTDSEQARGKIAALEQELTATQMKLTETVAQRDAAGRILRQQTAVVGRLQRELMEFRNLRTSQHLARLVIDRLHPGLKRAVPTRLKQFVKTRMLRLGR